MEEVEQKGTVLSSPIGQAVSLVHQSFDEVAACPHAEGSCICNQSVID